MSGGLITQQQFDELVSSTTRYLQDLVNRVGELEKKVEKLEAKKPARGKTSE